MIRAGIDLGTHTGRLIIAEVKKDKIIEVIHKQAKIIALGEGTSLTGEISHAALKRSLALLQEYQKTIASYQVERLYAVTTNAVRLAANKEEVLTNIRNETGINLEVISGEEEARLGFLGVKSAFTDEDLLSFDIGGGSTEFSFCQDERMTACFSLPVGAVSLTESFCHSDPISAGDFTRITVEAQTAILAAQDDLQQPYQRLIGVAGTVTNLAAIKQNMANYDPLKIHKTSLSLLDIDDMIGDFRERTIKERKAIVGLEPERARVILAGAVLVKCVLENSPLTKITVSVSDLLEGLLLV